MEVYFTDGTYRLFALTDIRRLRCEANICGVLTGTLPQVAQQNVFLGSPLVLLPEEVSLLTREGMCATRVLNLLPRHGSNRTAMSLLVDDKVAHKQASAEQAARVQLERSTSGRLQNERLRRKEDLRRCAAQSLLGARLVRGESGEQAGPAPSENAVPLTAPLASIGSRESLSEGTKINTKSDSDYLVHIETESAAEWHDAASAVIAPDLHFKASNAMCGGAEKIRQARHAIFADLWRRKFMMGGALRFGGNYLVYPGDPLRYHSHFTATILPDHQAAVPMTSLVANGRLATAVKKAHLFCALEEGSEGAHYMTLTWSAM